MKCYGSRESAHYTCPPALTPTGRLSFAARAPTTWKNVDLALPQRSLVVMTGVSGSGKSSLAFDTIYAEGQRRYVGIAVRLRASVPRADGEAGRRFASRASRPAIAIRQKNSIRNPRSTVGTTTEIHDYLRLLYARIGRTICRSCGKEVIRETAEVVAASLGKLPAGTRLLIGFDMPIVPASPMSLPVEADWTMTRRRRRAMADGARSRHRRSRALRAGRLDRRDARGSCAARGFGRLYVDGQTVMLEEADRRDARAIGRCCR